MAKILSLITLFFSFNSYSFEYSIISDLDDTIKVTNVQNWSAAVRNALFSKKSFKEMPNLLMEMKSYSNDLYILSASPKMLNGRIDSFLVYNKIETKDVFTRNLISDSNKRAYKLRTIRSVLKKIGSDSLILIGDNVEIDHEVYKQIKIENPGRIAAIYIHKVKNKKLPREIIGFYTAYDIALAEYKADRMSFMQALTIGKNLLLESKFSKVIPKFSYCPKAETDFEKIEFNALTLMTKQIRAKLLKFCK